MEHTTAYQFLKTPFSSIRILCLVVCVLLLSCKKEEVKPMDYETYVFGSEGKNFSFIQPLKMNGEYRLVVINVPEGTTDTKQSIECYTMFLDTGEVKNYYINWWVGDVNLVCSSLLQPRKDVTIKIPMPWNTYSASNLYKPYKIKMKKSDRFADAVNNHANWEAITNFTWDNPNKQIIIQTSDLNAAYIMARPK